MNNGLMPTYEFRPAWSAQEQVKLRTVTSRRARLWAGGTYFRARDPGRHGNNISVQVVEVLNNPTTPFEAYCIITNYNAKIDEQVSGGEVDICQLNQPYTSLWRFEDLTTTPTARQYSISCQISFAVSQGQPLQLDAPIDERPFTPGKLFYVPDQISLKTSKTSALFAPGDVISARQRFRIYQLLPKTASTEATGGTETTGPSSTVNGWDIDNLRAQINANDPWVEMIPRMAADATGQPSQAEPNDHQDTGSDEQVLSTFSEVRLAGGDGLPDTPTLERTGPVRSIVHLLFGELQNGQLAPHNRVYEWVGNTQDEGSWKPY